MKKASMHTHLMRTSLLVSIIAGLAIAGLNLSLLQQKVAKLQANLTVQTAARQKAELDLASTRDNLSATSAALEKTKTSLEAANLETQRAVAVEAAQLKRTEKLSGDLTIARKQLDEAQASLARYQAAGMQPEQIAGAANQIKNLQKALATAEKHNELMAAKIKRLASLQLGADEVFLPSDLKAKVICSDPKWHFIMLDAGEDQGVLERGEVLVSRRGKLVAKAKVSRVQKDHCVANLLPGWEFAEVVEGDVVVPAFPHS